MFKTNLDKYTDPARYLTQKYYFVKFAKTLV